MTAARSRRTAVLLICLVLWLVGAGCSSSARPASPGGSLAGSTVTADSPVSIHSALNAAVSTRTSLPTPESRLAHTTPAASISATVPTEATTSRLTRPATNRPAATGAAKPAGQARVFVGGSAAIGTALAQRMASTWHQGCPVPLSELSYLRMSYRGFDGRDHIGAMVVATVVARQVISAFHLLFDQKYPIRRMTLVDDFAGNDDASMAADNTSGFNCRPITGGVGFSEHSYGQAIDVDPVENPYIGGGRVLPPAGSAYVGRPQSAGVIHPGDATVAAFASIGWSWGGNWSSPRDLQHFSANGR